MTAAVPANGDGVRVCRIYNRRQSFISVGERNLLRQQELCVFGSSLGIAPRPTRDIRFPPSRIDVFPYVLQ